MHACKPLDDHISACEIYEEVCEELDQEAQGFAAELRAATAAVDDPTAERAEQHVAQALFGTLASTRLALAQQMRVNYSRAAHGGGHGGDDNEPVDSIVVPSARIAPLLTEVQEQVCEAYESEVAALPSVSLDGDGLAWCVPWSVQFAVGELLKNAIDASCARSADQPPVRDNT